MVANCSTTKKQFKSPIRGSQGADSQGFAPLLLLEWLQGKRGLEFLSGPQLITNIPTNISQKKRISYYLLIFALMHDSADNDTDFSANKLLQDCYIPAVWLPSIPV
jgi:hypothetical protein